MQSSTCRIPGESLEQKIKQLILNYFYVSIIYVVYIVLLIKKRKWQYSCRFVCIIKYKDVDIILRKCAKS